MSEIKYKYNNKNRGIKVVEGDFKPRESGKAALIEPLLIEGVKQYPALGAQPQRVERIPSSIGIDPDFQRTISHRGKALIREMIMQWDWHVFIPPAIYFDEKMGMEMAYDGQHTLIGAASRDDIRTIPCDLHASIEDAHMAAAAFLSRNTKRIGVSAQQRYKAAVHAKEDWAVKIFEMSKAVGFTVPFYPSTKTKPDTVLSVASLKGILEKRGVIDLRKIMNIIVGNAINPIREMHIVAVEMLLFEPEYRKLVDGSRLRSVIRGINNHIAIGDAQTESIKRGMTRAQALANIYLREYQGVYGVH